MLKNDQCSVGETEVTQVISHRLSSGFGVISGDLTLLILLPCSLFPCYQSEGIKCCKQKALEFTEGMISLQTQNDLTPC